MSRSPFAALCLSASFLLGACAETPGADGDGAPCRGKCDGGGGLGDADGDGASLCLAIRGNGPRITAHFGAIARLLEHHGPIDAVAGGSSGSISAFLLESVQGNPAARTCAGRACTPREAGERAALLFKSVQGYVEVLADTDEALAFAETARLAQAIAARDVEALLASDPEAGVAALRGVLTSPTLRALVNPELLELLATSPDPAFHARDLAATLSRGLSFTADDPTIFVRPGAVDFPAFIERVGRVASFYAGYGPDDGGALASWLDDCAPRARGLTWAEIARLPRGGATCGADFRALLGRWRDATLARPGAYRSRLDDAVGARLPALVTTGVLEGDAIDAWHGARAAYLEAGPVALAVDYADVGVGYWGHRDDLAALLAGAARRDDLKSRKRTSLGEATWRVALAASPAEPGLSRGVELDDGRISVGGWSDLQPVLALEDLGCDRTVFLTRFGGAGSFERGITELLGIDDAEAHALFALADPASSYYQALEAAAGVWCSDWDTPPVTDLPRMTSVGYDAAFETTDPAFTEADLPYAGAVARTGIAGCTLGVTE